MNETLKGIHEDLVMALGCLGEAEYMNSRDRRQRMADAREYIMRALEKLTRLADSSTDAGGDRPAEP